MEILNMDTLSFGEGKEKKKFPYEYVYSYIYGFIGIMNKLPFTWT